MDFSKPGPAADRQHGGRSRRHARAGLGGAYSALIGLCAGRALPSRLRPFAYRVFANAVGADLSEVELELEEYASFGDFFARRLRAGSRTIDPSRSAVVSPCDGVVAARGTVTEGALVQAKGRMYRLDDLLANDELAARLGGGDYTTIYLSPRDYHRVHSPVAGRLVSYDYIPGALWPVNPRVASRRDGLLVRNERVVIHLNAGALGDVAVVMVGAAGVGNIAVAHGPGSASLRAASERRRIELNDISVERGDELGAFRLGSTVVLVFQPGKIRLRELELGQAVRFGELIGQVSEGSA